MLLMLEHWRRRLTVTACVLLGGCTLGPAPVGPATSAVPPSSAPAATSAPAAAPAPVPLLAEPAEGLNRRLLSYHDQLRQMSAADLGQELTRLNAMVSANSQSASPTLVLELSLALGLTRNPADLQRAHALLEPIVKSSQPEMAPWQPFARLLSNRYAEQRRAEDQLERQAQQLRDAQRQLSQTNDKLEALKAIERSLTARPPTAPPAPARASSGSPNAKAP